MKVRMWKVSVEDWLQIACNRLRHHSILTNPQTEVAREAKSTCEQYVWNGNTLPTSQPSVTSSPSQVEQPIASPTPVESLPAPATPQPSPSIEPTSSPEPERSPSPTITYEFPPFPQPSCGDPPTPGATWYPVFINEGNEEEIRRKYCGDADSRIRESTGRPAVLVASFTDREKAEAFAREVGGEVGEP